MNHGPFLSGEGEKINADEKLRIEREEIWVLGGEEMQGIKGTIPSDVMGVGE